MSIHRHACLVCGKESNLQEGVRIGTTLVALPYCEHHRPAIQEMVGLVNIGIAALVAVNQEGQKRLQQDQLNLAVDRNLRVLHGS